MVHARPARVRWTQLRWIAALLVVAAVGCSNPADDTLAVAESSSQATKNLDLDATMALDADEGLSFSEPHFTGELAHKSAIAIA